MHGPSAPPLADVRFFGPMPFGSRQEAREIIGLVTMVLSDALAGVGKPMFEGVMLEMLSGGRSGAYIFKATSAARGGDMSDALSVAVKIAPLDAGTSEKANYDRFVHPVLPKAYRPILYGFATAHDRAALCYSFFGDGDRADTLTDRLAAADHASLDVVLSSLFGMLRYRWYAASEIRSEADLARYYLGRYFEDPGSAIVAETVLFDDAARYFDAQRCVPGIGNTVFPPLCETLFAGGPARAYTSCILHGDLNSDNVILCCDRRSAGMVDFQRTGRGHVFQDLVALEMSVRINYPSDDSFGDILEVERLIALGQSRLRSDPYARALLDIRDTAHRLFGLDAVLATYQFAVACIGLRLMKATDLSDPARARIIASVLWAAKALAKV